MASTTTEAEKARKQEVEGQQEEVEEVEEEDEEEDEEDFAAPEDIQEEGEEDDAEEEREAEDGGEEVETTAEAAAAAVPHEPSKGSVEPSPTKTESVVADAPATQDQERVAEAANDEALNARIQASPSQVVSPAASTATTSVVGDMDLKNLEAQATKVAHDMQTAAFEMSSKFTASFKSALGGLGAAEPQSLTKLAGGLANWWSSLDPPAQPRRNETAEQVQASSKATSELQELLGLLPEENLVESFKCKLLQTYGCSHNTFTPAIQMAFQGTLYITDKHTCFTVEERNRKMPFKVLHTQIAKAERHRPQRKGDLSDVLRLDLVAGTSGDAAQQFLAFKDFDSGSALDSALALVEHLMDGS